MLGTKHCAEQKLFIYESYVRRRFIRPIPWSFPRKYWQYNAVYSYGPLYQEKFGPQPFSLTIVKKCGSNIQYYNFAYVSIWVWNMVSDSMGET
jgi:hypothetical protein